MFPAYCEAQGLPRPVPEFRFHLKRLWRFDWAWVEPQYRIALEVEGGVWNGGAHLRGKHFLSDVEKYNEASLAGWLLLRCTPQDMEDSSVFTLLHRAFDARRIVT